MHETKLSNIWTFCLIFHIFNFSSATKGCFYSRTRVCVLLDTLKVNKIIKQNIQGVLIASILNLRLISAFCFIRYLLLIVWTGAPVFSRMVVFVQYHGEVKTVLNVIVLRQAAVMLKLENVTAWKVGSGYNLPWTRCDVFLRIFSHEGAIIFSSVMGKYQ